MLRQHLAFALAAGTTITLALSGGAATAQGGFTCPTQTAPTTHQPVIQSALPSGDAFEDPDALVAAVTALHAEGVPAVDTVDSLIAAYCPVVANDAALADAAKTQAVNRFAARVTRVVYGLDSADAIILDVPFPPAMLDAITEKARQAGVPPQDWVRDVVEIALD